MILAWTLNVALVALYIKSTAYGAGVVHMWDVPLSNSLAIVKVRLSTHFYFYSSTPFFINLTPAVSKHSRHPLPTPHPLHQALHPPPTHPSLLPLPHRPPSTSLSPPSSLSTPSPTAQSPSPSYRRVRQTARSGSLLRMGLVSTRRSSLL